MLEKYKIELRENKTLAENLLWSCLRNRKLGGFKFRRQHILHGYIVDFVCLEINLIVEADGEQHAEQMDYDNARTLVLNQKGFRIIRFWNHQIMADVSGVLAIIFNALIEMS